MCDMTSLPKLEEDDYLKKDFNFWKKYRELLYEEIKRQEKEDKINKTPENIVEMAESIGVKATARYFDITPSSVRYYRNKLKS